MTSHPFTRALETRTSSAFAALRPRGASPVSINDAKGLLDASGLTLTRFDPASPTIVGALWEAELELDVGGATRFALRLACAPSPARAFELASLVRGGFDVTDADLEAARSSATSMHVSAALGDPLGDFHDVLRVLASVAPDAVLFFDIAALSARPASWLEGAAFARTPPAPESLFSVHAVGDGNRPRWLHTHGLARLGVIELDATSVPAADVGLVGQLVNAVAKYFLDAGVPPPDEPFEAGRGMPLVWLPWQDGVRHVSGGGGARDHDDIDHGGARGILFARTRGFFGGTKYVSPAHWARTLRGHPVFHISHMETARAASLAVERFPRFASLFEAFGKSADWKFLVKIGHRVDGATDPLDREHLWFEVHAIHPDRVNATCLNQPYAVSRLAPGVRGMHDLTDLSGFTILSAHGSFDAERIDALERATGRS